MFARMLSHSAQQQTAPAWLSQPAQTRASASAGSQVISSSNVLAGSGQALGMRTLLRTATSQWAAALELPDCSW
jgi:hypothetical protein